MPILGRGKNLPIQRSHIYLTRADCPTIGVHFTVSVFAKALALRSGHEARLRIRWLDSFGDVVSNYLIGGVGPNTVNYVEITEDLVAPPNARVAEIRLINTGGNQGVVYFDHVQFFGTIPTLTYPIYRDYRLNDTNLTTFEKGENGDPDGDSILNIVEYATNSNPQQQDKPVLTMTEDETEFYFDLRNNDPNLSARIEVSFDLNTWTPLTLNPTYSIPGTVEFVSKRSLDATLDRYTFSLDCSLKKIFVRLVLSY